MERQVATLKEELREKTKTLSTEVRVLEAKLRATEEEAKGNGERLRTTTKRLAQLEVENENVAGNARAHEEDAKELRRKMQELMEKVAILEVESEERNGLANHRPRHSASSSDSSSPHSRRKEGSQELVRAGGFRDWETSFFVIFFHLHQQEGEQQFEWEEDEATPTDAGHHPGAAEEGPPQPSAEEVAPEGPSQSPNDESGNQS